MKRGCMKRRWLAAIFMAAAAGAAFGYPGIGTVSMDQRAIVRIFEAYCETQNAADPEAWIALWDVDGVKMTPGAPTIYGKPAIYTRTKANFPLYRKNMAIDIHEIVVMGDLAFADGTYTVNSIVVATGAKMSTDGKFMTVLRKQPDGTWLIYRDITNSNN